MADFGEVFGDLFEGDAVGDPLTDDVAESGREMGDFAARFAVGRGIAKIRPFRSVDFGFRIWGDGSRHLGGFGRWFGASSRLVAGARLLA